MISTLLVALAAATLLLLIRTIRKAMEYGFDYIEDWFLDLVVFLAWSALVTLVVWITYPYSLYYQPRITNLATFTEKEGTAYIETNTYDAKVNNESYVIDQVKEQSDLKTGSRFVFRKYVYEPKPEEFLAHFLGTRVEYKGTLYLPKVEYDNYAKKQNDKN